MSLIRDIQKLLESQKLTLGFVAMMYVYLRSNPATDGSRILTPLLPKALSTIQPKCFEAHSKGNEPVKKQLEALGDARCRLGH